MVVNINFRPNTASCNNSNESTNGSSVGSPNSDIHDTLNRQSTLIIGRRRKRKERAERGNNKRNVMCSDIWRRSDGTYNSTQELTLNSCPRKASQSINRSFSSLLLIFLIFIQQSHLYYTQNTKQQYNTTHACEGDELEINCDLNYYIDIIRANFGRFSVTICNSEYIQELPTKCMTKSAHRIIHKRCQDQQNCRVLASEALFNNNTCPGVPKYLEVSFKCVNSNSTRNASKRTHGNVQRQPVNDTGFLFKNGKSNPSINDVRTSFDRSVDSVIYDRSNYPTDELNKKPSIPAIISPNPLDNNQNPFLNGKRVAPAESRPDERFNKADQSSNKFEIKESPRPALIDTRRPPTNLTNYCPATKIKGASFELTHAGKLVTVPCPAGSTNLVSWYCAQASEGGQRAMWKDRADFSRCSSLWLNSMDERLKDKYVMISKLSQELATVTNLHQDVDQNLGNQNLFIGIETPKQLNAILSTNERSQQSLYARDLYRISEIVNILVNKLEALIENSSDSNKLQQQFNEQQRKKQSSLIHEMLTKIQDTISNLLEEQNRDSWLELQPSERTLAISSLMSSLKKNALLFASVRTMVSSNFDRFTRNLFVSVIVRQLTASNIQPLQLPIRRSARSDADLSTASEIGEEDSDDKQVKCSILISSEKINQQSMHNLAKFIFIIYEQLGQLMPIEETRTRIKRYINTFDTANQMPTMSDQPSANSIVVSEIISLFSQKESSVYSMPNGKSESEPFIELTFIHNKFGLQANLTNYRCVQLQDSETIPYSMTSNNRVLSVEQAALAVANEQSNSQSNSQVSSTELNFLAQSSTCQTMFTNSTQTKCRCKSLGTFTVLANVGGSSDEIENQATIQTRLNLMLKLNRICILSGAISAVLLFITIISFYFHKNNLRSTKTINHLLFLRNNQTQLPGHLSKAVNYQNILLSNQAKINYLICLFFLECAMLTSLSLSESAQNNQVFCRLASLAIHYFLLTVFAWLLFDCFISSYLLVFTETRQHQHNQTSNMFNQAQPLVILNSNGFPTTTTTSSLDLQNSTRQYTLRTCKLLTYLLPLFIVVLSSWIEPSSYCSKSWKSSVLRSSNELYAICWHAFDNIYIMFFVVPLIALLLASVVFVVVSIALRLRIKNLTDQQSNKQFTYLANGSDVNQKMEAINSKHNLFASNTRINLYNVLITTCCWLAASLYLTSLLETFENFHYNSQQFEQSTYVEPVASGSFARAFIKLPDSNLALFAFLFAILNTLHSLLLLIKLGIREGIVSSLFGQLANICLFKSKQHSLNNLSQLYLPPNCYGDNQTNAANLDSLKYEQKQFNLSGNKFEQPNGGLNLNTNHLQQPLIPPPQLIASKKYQLTQQPQNYNTLIRDEDDVYENEDQQPFSEQQSTSETILASDPQTSEQSDSEQFSVRNKSFNDQFANQEFVLKKNKVYGQKNVKMSNAQMENFYECIEENGQFYEPMIYSSAYGEHQSTDYPLQNRLIQSKYNRLIGNQQNNFSDAESNEYENPIERFNRARTTNKLLRNYSSNDFLSERDTKSRIDQPLLPAIVRDNTNYPQFSLSSTNHRNFSPLKSNRYNPTNASFSSTIGRNVLLSTNGLRGSGHFRTAKQTKDMISEQEQSLKQIQQQLKNFQIQLAIHSPPNLTSQENELKNKFDGQSAQQNSYLSSNSSVSDNVNSSV